MVPPNTPVGGAVVAGEKKNADSELRLRVFRRCLEEHGMEGWQRIYDWIAMPKSPVPGVEHLQRVLAYGRAVERRAKVGDIKDQVALWIAAVNKAKYPPPDEDVQKTKRAWARAEEGLFPLTKEVKGLVGKVGQAL
jgi:hypothetical protein